MSTDISVDVDTLDAPPLVMIKLAESIHKSRQRFSAWRQTINEHNAMFKRIEALGVEPTLNLSDDDIQMFFSGTAQLLRQVWHELRIAGYKNMSVPRKGETTLSVYWERSGHVKIWMYFSSTECKAVRVGTKMVEQPVYEVQCGEMPAIEQLETPSELAELGV